MEHAMELFSLVVFFYLGIGIVGYHLLNKLQNILDKLEEIRDLIPVGKEKLDKYV